MNNMKKIFAAAIVFSLFIGAASAATASITQEGQTQIPGEVYENGGLVDDFDADGQDEFLTSSSDENMYMIEHNGSSATVAANISLKYSDYWMSKADANQDGKPEIYAEGGSGNITAFEYAGSDFNTLAVSDIKPIPESVIAADISDDGDVEIGFVPLNTDNVYSTLSFNGTHFSDHSTASLPEDPGADYAAHMIQDIDDDGSEEIVLRDSVYNNYFAMNYDDSTNSVSLQDTFNHNGSGTPSPAGAGDYDGDGTTEIAVGSSGGSLGISSWNETDYTIEESISTGGTHVTPLFNDLDGDGNQEIVYSDKGDTALEIYTYDGNTLTEVGRHSFSGDTDDQQPALGDVDGDGTTEIMIGTWGDKIHVLNFNGSSLNLEDSMGANNDLDGTPTLTGDLDGDGITEFVQGAYSSGDIYVWSAGGQAENHWGAAAGGERYFGGFEDFTTPSNDGLSDTTDGDVLVGNTFNITGKVSDNRDLSAAYLHYTNDSNVNRITIKESVVGGQQISGTEQIDTSGMNAQTIDYWMTAYDDAGNELHTNNQSVQVITNKAPTFSSQVIDIDNYLGSQTSELNYSISDPDGDEISSHNNPTSGTVQEFTNSTYRITGVGSSLSYTAEVSDFKGATGSIKTDYNVTDIGWQESTSFTNTIDTQRAEVPVTLSNNGDVIGYSLSVDTIGTPINDTFSGTLTTDETVNKYAVGENDWISESESEWSLDYGKVQETGNIINIQRDWVNVTNTINEPVKFENISINKFERSGWSCTSRSNFNISSGETINMQDAVNCSKNAVTESLDYHTIDGSRVVVGDNVTAKTVVNVNNTDQSYNHSNITLDMKDKMINGIGKIYNTTKDEKNISINAGQSNNYNVEYKTQIAEKDTDMSCDAGFTKYSNYCYSKESVSDGEHYIYKWYVNVSSPEASDKKYKLELGDTGMQNYEDGEQFEVSVNGSAVGVSHDQLNNLSDSGIFVDTNYGSSSLEDEYYVFKMEYDYSGGSPTDGGDSGGTTDPVDDGDENVTTIDRIKDLNLLRFTEDDYAIEVVEPFSSTYQIGLVNDMAETKNVTINRRGGDACEYIEFTNAANSAYFGATVDPAGSIVQSSKIEYTVNPPENQRITGTSCKYELQYRGEVIDEADIVITDEQRIFPDIDIVDFLSSPIYDGEICTDLEATTKSGECDKKMDLSGLKVYHLFSLVALVVAFPVIRRLWRQLKILWKSIIKRIGGWR